MKPITLSEIVYAASFALLFGYRAWGGVDGPAFYTPMILTAVAIMVVKIAMTEHSPAELVCIGALLLCAGITYCLTGEKGLLIDYALMLGMKGITEKRLFRFAAWILGSAMFLVMLPYALGFLQETIVMGGRYPWMPYRYCLGYPHTNTLLTTYIILMMLAMYLTGVRDQRRILIRSLIMALGALFLWLWCDSKTGALITVLYLALNLYFARFARFGMFDRILIYGLYPLITFVAVGGSLLYGAIESISSNRVLHSLMERFRLTHMYVETYPFTLFGVRIVIPEDEFYAIDVSQMHLLLNLGIIAFVTVSVLYYILLIDCVRGKRRGELSIILSLMIMGVSDPLLYNLSCKNLTFLFMGAALYRLFARYRSKSDKASDESAGDHEADVISSASGLGKWFSAGVLFLPAGRKELPRLTAFLERADIWIRSTLIEGKKTGRLLISLATASAVMLIYALCMGSHIKPIGENLLAGRYVFALHTLSWGVYSFVIAYVLTGVIRSVRSDSD